MIKNLIDEFSNQSNFILAYSGGVDSTVLLHQLIKLKNTIHSIKFRAIHINHNMHPQSNQWSIFCQKICDYYNIEIVIDSISNYKKKNYGIEADLREKRYQKIQKYLKKSEILLTAHHLNDQFETFMLSIKRGSGPTGISCMPYKKNIGYNNIHCRPLLHITKKEILNWANKKKLKWLSDPNNKNIKFDRSFLRNKIIPIIEKKWPFFINNCIRSIKICNEERKLLNKITLKKFKLLLCSNNSLNIKNFDQYDESMRNLILRHWIKFHNQEMPSYKMIKYIYKKIIFKTHNNNSCIQFKNYEIRRYRTQIYLLPFKNKINNLILFWKNYDTPLILPNSLGILKKNKYGSNLPVPKSNETINIRFQIKNKKIKINSKQKEIRKIWQSIGIPVWERKQIPFLYYNNIFIAALGYFKNQEQNLYKRKTWNISWENILS